MCRELILELATHINKLGINKKSFPTNWLDIGVYKSNATLRLPFCKKHDAKTGQEMPDSILITDCDMKDICVTYIDGYQEIDMPMCFSKKPIIDFEHELE